MRNSVTEQADATAVDSPLQPASEWRRGWRPLASGFIGTGTGSGLFIMTAGLFIIPMQEEFGWSRSALTIGPVIIFFSAFLQPLAGEIVDRFGARPSVIAGMPCIARRIRCWL